MRAEQALGEHESEVLEVALAPAPVAPHLLEQRRRHLLVAAAEIVGEPERPARAAHQRRLDEVVAQDLAAERRLPGQPRQAAVIHERRDADDRVVAPVLAVAELPEVQPGGEHRAVDAARELLHAREQRAAVHRGRRGLDHADVGMAVHQFAASSHDRVARS